MKLLEISLLACLCVSTASWALSSDTQQPLYINADSQSLDMKNNQVTFNGDVTLKQGSINIQADKLIVIRPKNKEGREIIEAYGNPARFSQMTDTGETLKGKANKLKYEVAKEFLRMSGKAELAQDDSLIQSEMITYQISTQKLMADGGENKRVTTILQPSQLNNK
ncbi:lipopolysaccharide transport periplasmic protein LptA [Vibrio sp. Of7-15]|uniref:lipopolysaccharide transport periplasmic protein LptA n=1 Tax=Vibrio sp. Of7-15 TaxID=2724879 RepID=UPI001EF334E8|nr:lipopolysaccharide transport periplasmic protein LptA [Vibrio sp. Of7-15]MCG7498150.1 lipopolysaccharide transport periplasmic protein LptA [Vibrio sp. Of7-15]